MLQIQVSDSGCGIPEDVQSQLLKPPSQENEDLAGAGLDGLGLYVCKVLLQNLGGQIKINSKENVGTKCSIMVPAIPPEQKFSPKSKKASNVSEIQQCIDFRYRMSPEPGREELKYLNYEEKFTSEQG